MTAPAIWRLERAADGMTLRAGERHEFEGERFMIASYDGLRVWVRRYGGVRKGYGKPIKRRPHLVGLRIVLVQASRP